jgi:hypothetical protein
MLDPSYFDGSRELELESLLRQFDEPLCLSNGTAFIAPIVQIDDLLIQRKVFFDVTGYNKSLESYFLFFCKNTIITNRKKRRHVIVHYPVIDGNLVASTKEFFFNYDDLYAFISSDMYNDEYDVPKYELLMRTGGTVSLPEFLGARASVEDGQLKILLEVILAVDSADLVEGDKILVVGSSSPDGVQSGLAYQIIASMAPGVIVDMFDPHEVGGSYILEEEKKKTYFNCYREYKTIGQDDTKEYKLYLDDAWSGKKGYYRKQWDPYDLYINFPHFSIKWFDDWGDAKRGSVHYQVSKTPQLERRRVSRDIDFFRYTPNDLLGTCPVCVEFKYRVKKKYPKRVYDIFMKVHIRHCVTKQKNRMILRADNLRTLGTTHWHPIECSLRLLQQHKFFAVRDGMCLPPVVYSVFKESRVYVEDYEDIDLDMMHNLVIYKRGPECFINRRNDFIQKMFTFKKSKYYTAIRGRWWYQISRCSPTYFRCLAIDKVDGYEAQMYHDTDFYNFFVVISQPELHISRMMSLANVALKWEGKFYANKSCRDVVFVPDVQPLLLQCFTQKIYSSQIFKKRKEKFKTDKSTQRLANFRYKMIQSV